MEDLSHLTRVLAQVVYDSSATPRYDVMSDGLVWSDEAPLKQPPREWWTIRPLWRHRAALMLGEAPPFAELWDAMQRLCPVWPGFRSERCSQAQRLLDILRAGRQAWPRE